MEQDHEIIIAGFGGQGVLFAGMVLAHAAMRCGLNVAWIPSYGPEMRGGTARCTVIISKEEIGSPIVNHPSAAVVMNEPSLAKYGPRVLPGGTLVINRSLARAPFTRPDIRIVEVGANEVAAELGSERAANMVALGALLGSVGCLAVEDVEAAMPEALGPVKERFVEVNCGAIRRGIALVREQVAVP
ncbi:MAG TPA: 2-oxoacid:acceptor oxidoreductase family protein [Chloroflexota bacterium]|nr:2-oxoacid:acceptor oxidoreductase family protein [Chloroflexota bacterium]